MEKENKSASSLVKFKSLLNQEQIKNKFNEALGKKAPMFISNLVTIASGSAELQKCEHMSIISSALMAASMDLPLTPGLGFAGIVPYWDGPSGMMKAQFQVMKKGFIQLAQRTGLFKTINVCEVYKGEIKKHNRFTGEYEFDEAGKLSDEIIGYVSFFKLVNGFEKFYYMPIEKLETHAKRYSKSFQRGKGKWADKSDGGFEQMCEKTVLKLNLSTYAPLSVDINMMNAVIYDQAEIRDVEAKEYEYMDNDEASEQKTLEVFETKSGSSIVVDKKHMDRGETLISKANAIIDKRNGKVDEKDALEIAFDKEVPPLRRGMVVIKDGVDNIIPIYTDAEMAKMQTDELDGLINTDDEMIIATKVIPGRNTNKKLRTIILAKIDGTLKQLLDENESDPNTIVEETTSTSPPIMLDDDDPFNVPMVAVESEDDDVDTNNGTDDYESNVFGIMVTDNPGGRRPFDEVKQLHEEFSTIAGLDNTAFISILSTKLPQFQHYKNMEEFCYSGTKSEINTLLNSI